MNTGNEKLLNFSEKMKINLSYPATGCQKLIEIADELKVGGIMILVFLIIPCCH